MFIFSPDPLDRFVSIFFFNTGNLGGMSMDLKVQ